MRINILIAGGLILAVSILLLSSEIVASFFGFALGGLNIVIGILTRKAVGIVVPADQLGPLKLSLDKGVIRTNIYTIAFSDKKLVLRKLSSANLTVATALILALLGAALAGPFGIIVGGITAFSLQEFVTQRRRNEIKKNLLDPSGHGDLDFPYDELEQVQLLGNRIQLRLKDRIVRIAVSRKYSRIMGPVLEKIIPAKIQSEPVPSGRAP
ncbi:MAG TPA: hypothetical protein VEL71_04510 [Candidatus Dormibacteraeota bacterium]|nr:hypothetical protein [Candidatus Dormibacteraeota bacterium]